MQSTVINLRIENDQIEILDKMAGKALNRQAVARMLLIAAIEAVKANGGMISLPPKFNVQDNTPFHATRFNEPTTPKRK